ncbi:hypothetical protein CE91St36_03150 [Christensenellaceae bacterium]|nr:hypothetical protein CE91St36_03150 [Christensenellaceae bacterium]BDF60166.1 hypothetical protein CE91St37_03160 [Christensenellaceae bacterium]
MIVVKKSGLTEEFSLGKLRHSVRSANLNTDESIYLPGLLASFQQIIEEKSQITSEQIDIILFGLLYSKGHMRTLLNYVSYEK